ncbi:PREDICTED: uncharacterized protein LOC106146412 [Chinchilla lanigera]|uniref:uncharacterized protein LOC106146412 n=1 Tax=Chinchilla lanigera TaxID=34839 RepID=UPI000697EA21|nr:PREDICTED: uncharacterized protein LOC106146412 [Chinchilla lanigera]
MEDGIAGDCSMRKTEVRNALPHSKYLAPSSHDGGQPACRKPQLGAHGRKGRKVKHLGFFQGYGKRLKERSGDSFVPALFVAPSTHACFRASAGSMNPPSEGGGETARPERTLDLKSKFSKRYDMFEFGLEKQREGHQGAILMGDGEGDGSWDALLGPPPPLSLIGAHWRLKCRTQGRQAESWQKGKEETSFTYWSCHLMKAKLAWGRPQATDVGGGPAKTALRFLYRSNGSLSPSGRFLAGNELEVLRTHLTHLKRPPKEEQFTVCSHLMKSYDAWCIRSKMEELQADVKATWSCT